MDKPKGSIRISIKYRTHGIYKKLGQTRRLTPQRATVDGPTCICERATDGYHRDCPVHNAGYWE